MAIELREYLGYKARVTSISDYAPLSVTEASTDPIDQDMLLVDIEGIHSAPMATRNFTRYTKECLKRSAEQWTNPYKRPLIKFHNETDGQIIGRILNAEYVTKSAVDGSSALLFTVMVPKEPDSSDVKSGLLETVSIGAIAKDVRCSICGQNLAEDGECEHERGQVYDGERCYWDVYDIEPKELSYVIVPSDPYAKNKKIYTGKSVVPPKLNEASEDIIGGTTLDEKEKQELTGKIEELETALEAANQSNTDLTAEKESIVKELEELKAKLAEIDALLNKTSEEKDQAVAETETIKAAQEAAESQAIEAKEAYRALLVSNVNFSRKMAGKKELEESVIAERSDQSLMDSLTDLREELMGALPQKLENPTLPNLTEQANNKESLKESKKEEEIDLDTAVKDLFMNVIN